MIGAERSLPGSSSAIDGLGARVDRTDVRDDGLDAGCLWGERANWGEGEPNEDIKSEKKGR